MDFHANPTAQPENGLEKRINATSGRRCLESFANSGHGTLWAKTWLESLVGTGAWYSRRCKLTWKLKGTKYKRLYFQLAPSTLPTEGIGFGLLPTVVSMDYMDPKTDKAWKKEMEETRKGRTKPGNLRDVPGRMPNLLPTPETQNHRDGTNLRKDNNIQEGGSHGVSFHHLAAHALLPTPQARDEKNGSKADSGRIARKMEQGYTIDLNDLAAMGALSMLPTPQAADGFKGCANQDQKSLHTTFQTGGDSQLNPRFVAEMMGFPVDWLELPFLDTAGSPSKPTGMQSCRKSRCRYSGRSLRRKGG